MRLRFPFNFNTCAALLYTAACISLLVASPAQAGRGIVIDPYTTVEMGDADNLQLEPLAFPIDYGSGLQTAATINLGPTSFALVGPAGFQVPAASANVGLSFASSPTDSLFATLTYVRNGLGDPFFNQGTGPASGVFLASGSISSTAAQPVSNASGFDFRLFQSFATSQDCSFGSASNPHYCYAPNVGSAVFTFTDLSASGSPGDFGLLVQCLSTISAFNGPTGCSSIGFNLNGASFSSAGGSLPSQFVSSCPPGARSCDANNSWYFVFRNAAAVPEPATWGMMLLGFAGIGTVMRRRKWALPQLA